MKLVVLGLGGGRRLAAVELSLRHLRDGARRRSPRAAAHAILHRAVGRRRALAGRQRVARHSPADRRDAGAASGATVRGTRPIAAVLLTNGDVDHVAGLLTLRESQPYRLYATKATRDSVDANRIFSVANPDFVPRAADRDGRAVRAAAGPARHHIRGAGQGAAVARGPRP